MITIYEKLETLEAGGETSQAFVECPQEEATHIHYCYNDETPLKACRREAL